MTKRQAIPMGTIERDKRYPRSQRWLGKCTVAGCYSGVFAGPNERMVSPRLCGHYYDKHLPPTAPTAKPVYL